MQRTYWTARRKLFASLVVLALVLSLAAIAQWTGKDNRVNPYATAPSQLPPATQPGTAAKIDPNGRAVFGGDTRAKPTATSPLPTRPDPPATEPTAENSTRSRTPTSGSGNEADIDQLLDRWRETIVRGDVEGHVDLYGPQMEQFFRLRKASHSAVRTVKSRMMEMYPKVNRYDISDVKVESNNGREAVVSLRKEWDMSGRQRFSGAERQRLKLRRIAGDWKIVSEEETKVYWTKRG